MFPYDDGESFSRPFSSATASRLSPRFSRSAGINRADYASGAIFEHIRFPAQILPKPIRHAKAFVTGAMGELETRILLEQYVSAGIAEMLVRSLRAPITVSMK